MLIGPQNTSADHELITPATALQPGGRCPYLFNIYDLHISFTLYNLISVAEIAFFNNLIIITFL
jgi:hypothetical protein